MRILFVHQNFPAQFVHLAPMLARRGHDVRALTPHTNTRQAPVPVVTYRFEPREFDARQLGLAVDFARMTQRGERVAQAAAQLTASGYTPDIVFGHPGWGETLYLRQVWPTARHLAYAEFFYRPRGLDTGFDPEFQRTDLAGDIWVTTRQAPHLLALNAVDAALSPTQWQAASYPTDFRHRITVVHDGIDTSRVAPQAGARVTLPGGLALAQGDEVLTFVARNLEPYRGYHIFMRALPAVLKARPDARVVLVGGDGVSYSTRPPQGTTWKQMLLDEVKDRLDLSRVHFVGQLPYPVFIDLMRVTRVHGYLTYPFVLSWSMLEAMSAGALVVGSATPPVSEVIEDGVNGRLVDFFDVAAWSQTLIEALAEPARHDAMRHAARQTIVDRYDLRTVCLPRLVGFVEGD